MASQMCAIGQTGSALRCERAFKQGPSALCTQRFSRRHLVCRATQVSSQHTSKVFSHLSRYLHEQAQDHAVGRSHVQDVMCLVTKHGFGYMKDYFRFHHL